MTGTAQTCCAVVTERNYKSNKYITITFTKNNWFIFIALCLTFIIKFTHENKNLKKKLVTLIFCNRPNNSLKR